MREPFASRSEATVPSEDLRERALHEILSLTPDPRDALDHLAFNRKIERLKEAAFIDFLGEKYERWLEHNELSSDLRRAYATGFVQALLVDRRAVELQARQGTVSRHLSSAREP